ncbi:helix-turn-helix domain-containing protein [Arcobacter sp.]|uniref:helix-turn-helix domain-containing protein n=1 Tax=Arcobacter sp. TaxID=1872629 RepID=UPI003D0D895F
MSSKKHINLLYRNIILIYKRIKQVREALSFSSQKDFSEDLNMPIRTYQSYEQAKVKDIPHTFLEKLNLKYNISLEWLITGEGEMFLKKNKMSNKKNYIELVNQYLEVLSHKQQEYYYHKIKSDVLELEIKENTTRT